MCVQHLQFLVKFINVMMVHDTYIIHKLLYTSREDEQRLNERLREVEREKDEEAKRLQELIDMQEEKHQRELEGLRNSEDRLKRELKFAMDEAKKKNIQEKL